MVNHHFKNFLCVLYPVSFFFLDSNTYFCPHLQVPACNHRNCCICISYNSLSRILSQTFTWSSGRWRKQLTGMMPGLLLMALIGTARVECRNAWVIMITACSYLACSLIFMAHTYFLQASQCKPGWQIYTHTRTVNQHLDTSRTRQRHGNLHTPNWITLGGILGYPEEQKKKGILSTVASLR